MEINCISQHCNHLGVYFDCILLEKSKDKKEVHLFLNNDYKKAKKKKSQN
jgi:hypothetical protein